MTFGRFSVVDVRDAAIGELVIAPECILFQRSADTPVHDISYVAVWTRSRIDAIARELITLATVAPAVVGETSPELHAILRRIAPAGRAVMLGGGQCRRTWRTLVRRQLEAELRATGPIRLPVSA